MNEDGLTRRQVLAGLGGAGVVVAGFGVARAARRPAYQRYTYAQSDDGGVLRVAWYETYDDGSGDEFQENQAGTGEDNATRVLDPNAGPSYVDDAPGPVVTLSNVLPGDSGVLVAGVEVAEVPEGEEGVDVWLRIGNFDQGWLPVEEAENGINEPESAAGDTSAADGELDEELRVALWKDGGVGGVVSPCDGRRGLAPLLAEGDLSTVTAERGDDAYGAGVKLYDCLAAGQSRCLAFAWEIPTTVGDRIQSDSVQFDIAFGATSCGDPNPWGVSE